jgi:hypothetical protein
MSDRTAAVRFLEICGTLEGRGGAPVHLNAVRDLLHARAFALGLAYGGVAVLFAAAVAVSLRKHVPDFAGVAFVVASWLAVRGAWGQELATAGVLLALILLAFGGAVVVFATRWLSRASGHPLLTTAVAITPGAVMLAKVTPLAGSGISRIVLALTTIAFGIALRDFDAMRGPRGAPWLLFAITAGGVYLAVPDTELARVMLGVAIPFVLLSVPRPLSPLGPAGSAALAGVFTWVVVVGGRGRPGSVVGGLATIGILVAEPLGRRTVGALGSLTLVARRRLDPRLYDRNRDDWLTSTLLIGVVQFVIALYASRVVARDDSAITAILVALPMIAVAIITVPLLYSDTRVNKEQAARARRHSSRRPRPYGVESRS